MFDNDMEVIKESQKFRFEHAIRIWHSSRPIQILSRDQIRNFIAKIQRVLAMTVERQQVLNSVPVTVDCAAFPVEC